MFRGACTASPRPWLAVAALSILAACAQKQADAPGLSKARIAEIVASPDRSAADRTNDLRRKPEEMLAFIGVRPGMVALDLSAGGGYTTELLARDRSHRAAGCYAQVPRAPSAGPSRRASPSRRWPQRDRGRAAVRGAGAGRVAAGGLDLVTLMFNYHDLGHLGVDRAAHEPRRVRGAEAGRGLRRRRPRRARRHRHLRVGDAAPRRGSLRRRKSRRAGFRLLAEGTSCATRTTRATARRPSRRSRRTSSS